MRDLIKTIIVVGILLLIGFISIFIVGNFEYGVELLTKSNLTFNDPKVSLLYKRIDGNNDFRKASLVNTELSDEEITKAILDNIKEDDYTKKNVKVEKITCEVAKGITFTTDSDKCKIIIIKNETMMNYQKELFNTEKELEYNEIKYHGYYCKNDKKKYYCLTSKYKDNIVGFSEFKDAYEIKDKIVIHEYYLKIDLTDRDYCLNYFNEDFCNNYEDKDIPKIDKDTILNNGVLYEHVFSKNGDSYYLEKSFIVSEG